MADNNDKDELETWKITSYERVFRQERKIHSIDGRKLWAPIPVDVLGWFIALLVASFIIEKLPGIGTAYRLLPTPVRLGGIPGLLTYVITRVETEGRPVLKFLWAWLRMLASNSHSLGRSVTDEAREVNLDWWVWISRDHYAPYLRRATIIGPARVQFRDQIWAKQNRTGSTVTVLGTAPSQRPLHKRLARGPFVPARRIDLPEGTTMEVLPR